MNFSLYELVKEDLLINNIRISTLLLLDSKDNYTDEDKLTGTKLIYSTEKYFSWDEVIEIEDFRINYDTFIEAQKFNLGLNKKISIDSQGFIRNYPNHKSVFGNIKKISLSVIINDENLKKMWSIPNDLIDLCNKCPYRYCCLSNSELFQINDNSFKKLKYCKINLC